MASSLKTLVATFYQKMKALLPSGDLPYILNHYINMCFCPIPFSGLSLGHWLLRLNLFLITRSVAYCHILYYFYHFLELSVEVSEDQPYKRTTAYIDVLMWLLMYALYIPVDLLLLNKSFHRAARSLFQQISEETRSIPNIKSGRRCLNIILFNDVIIQVPVTIFVVTTVWLGMKEFTDARISVQVHNLLIRAMSYSFVSLTVIGANMCVSFVIIFHSSLGYWIGETLEIFTEDLFARARENSISCEDIRNVIKRYTNLYMVVREINKLLRFPTLLIHAILTAQQMAEIFTMLTVRDSGIGSGASIFFDLMVVFILNLIFIIVKKYMC